MTLKRKVMQVAVLALAFSVAVGCSPTGGMDQPDPTILEGGNDGTAETNE